MVVVTYSKCLAKTKYIYKNGGRYLFKFHNVLTCKLQPPPPPLFLTTFAGCCIFPLEFIPDSTQIILRTFAFAAQYKPARSPLEAENLLFITDILSLKLSLVRPLQSFWETENVRFCRRV